MSAGESVREELKEVDFDTPSNATIATVAGAAGFFITLFIYFGFQLVFRELLSTNRIIEAMHGTSNSLCFAGMSSSATILPLMLTIFSFARSSETEFDTWFYDRVRTIALLCCASFLLGLLTLTVLSAPIVEADTINDTFYTSLYYTIVGGLSLLVGVLSAQITLLYFAIVHILQRLDPVDRG